MCEKTNQESCNQSEINKRAKSGRIFYESFGRWENTEICLCKTLFQNWRYENKFQKLHLIARK